ncbi:MAG: hypothetical protein IPP90_14780 [Gemmatimonadaceae bacterium]|nr:hypothetical protein [Gemmatimonadaceae bacterium]
MITRTGVSMRAVLLIAVVALSCRSRAGADKSAAANGASASGALALRLERGPCYGRCPEYTVELFDDGAVHFVGLKNVASLGAQKATVAAADVGALRKRLLDAGFASADTAYVGGSANCGQYFTDGPQLVLSTPIGATLKSVHLEAGCMGAPTYLKTLAAQVDSVARTSAWIAGKGDNK